MTAPTVLAVAETGDEIEANLWANALRGQDIRAEILTLGPRGALGGGVMFPGATFRVLVTGDKLEAARNIIADLGGADRLAPVAVGPPDDPMRIVWILGGIIVAFFGLGLLARLFVP